MYENKIIIRILKLKNLLDILIKKKKNVVFYEINYCVDELVNKISVRCRAIQIHFKFKITMI